VLESDRKRTIIERIVLLEGATLKRFRRGTLISAELNPRVFRERASII
jgi:hypothetical protein